MSENRVTLRQLTINDLDQVVVLDRTIGGVSRRGYFEKRLKAQTQHPDAFVSIAACDGNELVGFALARLLDGEFGGQDTVVVLDALAVNPARQAHGIGHQVMAALCEEGKKQGATELQSQASWSSEPELLSFFASIGLELAPRLVLERTTAGLDI
jgi:predicted N-acetyltransferase YhbS